MVRIGHVEALQDAQASCASAGVSFVKGDHLGKHHELLDRHVAQEKLREKTLLLRPRRTNTGIVEQAAE